MIVDTSAIVAMLRNEPDAGSFVDVLIEARGAKLSAGSWIELGAMLSKDAEGVFDTLNLVMEKLAIAIASVDEVQARMGQAAYRDFGKGFHPAALNFGDCFSYALAKATGEPLLFKGDDFKQTDVIPAL